MKAASIARTLAGFAILGVALVVLVQHPADEHLKYWAGIAAFGAFLISPETVLKGFKAVSPFAKKDAP